MRGAVADAVCVAPISQGVNLLLSSFLKQKLSLEVGYYLCRSGDHTNFSFRSSQKNE